MVGWRPLLTSGVDKVPRINGSTRIWVSGSGYSCPFPSSTVWSPRSSVLSSSFPFRNSAEFVLFTLPLRPLLWPSSVVISKRRVGQWGWRSWAPYVSPGGTWPLGRNFPPWASESSWKGRTWVSSKSLSWKHTPCSIHSITQHDDHPVLASQGWNSVSLIGLLHASPLQNLLKLPQHKISMFFLIFLSTYNRCSKLSYLGKELKNRDHWKKKQQASLDGVYVWAGQRFLSFDGYCSR